MRFTYPQPAEIWQRIKANGPSPVQQIPNLARQTGNDPVAALCLAVLLIDGLLRSAIDPDPMLQLILLAVAERPKAQPPKGNATQQ